MDNDNHLLVVKNNTLIQKSRYNLTAQEQKILLYIIARVKPTDTKLKPLQFSIIDFCKACNIKYNGKNYSDLKQHILNIANKNFWIETKPRVKELFHWIEQATVNLNSGTLIIKLDDKLTDYLIQLQKNYTFYKLENALHFQSKYSIRLYEFFKSIQYSKDKPYTASYTVQELYNLFNTSYKKFCDFNKRVIKTAVSEINTKSDITVFYETKKNNKREVTDIIFTIATK